MSICINEDIPIERINLEVFKNKNIEVYLQRDDLLHKDVSGNKWRKLKYVLEQYDKSTYNGIVSFGGSYSNHLAATAAACCLLDIPFVAYIRGEEPKDLNDTLQFLISQNAEIKWINRLEFRTLRNENWPNPDPENYKDYYVLPEGGYSNLGIKSCMEISKNWISDFNYACCSIGTGTTFSGMVNGLINTGTKSIGFIMLKDQGYLTNDIKDMTTHDNYILNRTYHFNGFGKVNDELVEFLNDFYRKTEIPLDPIYTGKMMYGIVKLANEDYFEPNSKVIAIHTGGLQGIKGCNEIRKKKKKSLIEYKR